MAAPYNVALAHLNTFVVKPQGDTPLMRFRAATPQLPLLPVDDQDYGVKFLAWVEGKLLQMLRKQAENPLGLEQRFGQLLLNMCSTRAQALESLKGTDSEGHWPNGNTTPWIRELYELVVDMTPGAYADYIRGRLSSEVSVMRERLVKEYSASMEFRVRVTGGLHSQAPLELLISVSGVRRGKSFNKDLSFSGVQCSGKLVELLDQLNAVVEQCRAALHNVTAPEGNAEFFKDPTAEELEALRMRRLVDQVVGGLSGPDRKALRENHELLRAAL